MSLLDKKTAVSVLAKTHENASTQIDVPGNLAAKIIQIGQQLIPDEALTGEGRVTNVHVTVKYGVQEDSETLRAVVAQFGPFTITLDKTQVFVASESGNAGGTPVVVECHSSEIKKLHDAVMQAMGTEADKFPYTPHITIAYVKPNEAQHFAGSDQFAGMTFTAQAVTLSLHDDNNQVKVPLGKRAADKPLLHQLQALRPEMAAAAQKVYDEWTQDEDDDFGGGGICDAIAQALQNIIVSSMVVDITEGGQDGDDHAWTIAFNDTEVYGVDIPPSVYETGGGYSWTKKEGVQLGPNDIEIFAVDIPASEFKSAAAAPSPAPEIPERPEQEMEENEPEEKEPEEKEPRYETRKQTHGDAWMIYDNTTGDMVDSADSQQEAYDIIKALEADLGPGAIQRTQPAVKPLPTAPPKGWRAPKKPVVQTTNFKKWFGSSKVVDEDGAPLKVFHGTTHEVDTFDIERANPENYYGKGFYFSSDPHDVEANYATPTGGDITSRLSQRAEQLEQELEEKFFEENGYYADGDQKDAIIELANDEAHKELLGPNKGTTMPVYLSIKKPVIIEKQGGTYFEINFDERTEQESGNGVDLYNAVLLCAGNYGGRGPEVWQAVSENAGPEFNAWKFEEVVRGLDYIEDENGSINSGSFIAEVYQELGYDGVIMNAWEEFGGGSKYKQMEMEYDTKHYIVWNPAQIKSATGNIGKFDKKNPSITGAVQPESKKFLESMGEKVVEEKTIGDYDFFVTYNGMMGVYQIGMQRVGMDAANISQQMEHQQQERGAGSRKELKATIQGWLNKYHMLVIGSMNPEKTMKYIRLLKAMGFNPQKQMVMGLPLAFISDGTIKTGSMKIAGRKDAVTSMVVTVDPEAVPWFPKQILIRYEQGMRWRQVLTAVKAIVGEVASKRVAWNSIYIWASPWRSYDEQQDGWDSKKSQGEIMYDVLHNGAFVSVGMEPQPQQPIGSSEGVNHDPCPTCTAPMHMHPMTADSHKVTPLSDTMYNNPEIGEETNAYADIPERVRGTEEMPALEVLAPQLFKEGSTYGVDPKVDAISKKYEDMGVSNYVSGSKIMSDYITLHEIVVPKDQRGEGLGTAFMEELTRYADSAGKIIVLTPDTVKGGTSVGRLQQFYGRFGFERNKGRNKDFKTQEAMIRRPIRKTAVYGEAQNQTQHTDQTNYGMTKTDPANPFAGEMAVLHEMLGKEPPVPAKPLSIDHPRGLDNSEQGKGQDAQGQNVTSSKKAGLSNLAAMGLYVAEEATVPGFELYVVGAKGDSEWFELAFQQSGADASQTETQSVKLAPKPIPTKELKAILDGWLAKYGKIHVMSYNSKYLQGYVRLLGKLGYTVDKEDELVEGKPAYYIAKTDAMAPTTPPDERESVVASQTILAANYEEMFKSTLALTDGWDMLDYPNAFVKPEIGWAKTYLKKSDRITWYLRWLRLSILEDAQTRMKRKQEEIAELYNQLSPGENGEPPKRYAVDVVKQQEGEKVQQGGEKLAALMELYQKELKAMTTRTGGVPWSVPQLQWFKTMHATFTHYLSLPVNKIQNVVWDKQAPDALLTDFSTAEKEWQEQTKGTLVPNLKPREVQPDEQQKLQDDIDAVTSTIEDLESKADPAEYQRLIDLKNLRFELEQKQKSQGSEVDTVFLQFQDGWAWWKLSRAYCSEEAKAMGHCGNVVGQQKTDERILSLRKPVKAGKEDRWEPHLTFILEPSGLLGEMKGKANAKPAPQYHKYIVALLEDKRIKGIRGGGYAPERNFSLADLPKEQQDELVAKKPGLMNAEMYLQRVGLDQTLIDRINGSLEWSLKYNPELKGWEMNTYPTLDEFIQEVGNDDAKYAGRVLNGEEDLDTSYDYSEWEYALDNLNSETRKSVENYIRTTYPEELEAWESENEEFDGSDVKRVIEDMNLDDVKDMLGRAMETGRRYGIEGQMYSAVVKAIDNMEDDEDNRLGVSVAYQSHTDEKGKKSPVWDSPVTEYFAAAAAAKLADSGNTWDQVTEDQYGRNETALNVKAPYNGWDEWSDEAFNDDILEQFGSPETPQEQAKKQQEMEIEAKKRPDLIPVRQNGKITGWQRNPQYKGPALGPGGVKMIMPDTSGWKVITEKDNTEFYGTRDVKLVDANGEMISMRSGTKLSDEDLIREAAIQQAKMPEKKKAPKKRKTKKRKSHLLNKAACGNRGGYASAFNDAAETEKREWIIDEDIRETLEGLDAEEN